MNNKYSNNYNKINSNNNISQRSRPESVPMFYFPMTVILLISRIYYRSHIDLVSVNEISVQ